MKVSFFSYELHPQSRGNRLAVGSSRKGVLLRIQEDEGIAYADCCPLAEFHEEEVGAQLRSLRMGAPTARMQRSLDLARWERSKRLQGEALLSRAHRLKTHRLITDAQGLTEKDVSLLLQMGFRHFKLKMGRNLEAETVALMFLADLLPDDGGIRLDFNSFFDPKSFRLWWESLIPETRAAIEFIEDPCPYAPDDWRELKSKTGARLALDMAGDPLSCDPESFDVVVIKPALQNSFSIWNRLKESKTEFVLTHSMDHPLGQLHAQAEALQCLPLMHSRLRPGGWASRDLYAETLLSDRLTAGPLLPDEPRPGVGVDVQLEGLQWTHLYG